MIKRLLVAVALLITIIGLGYYFLSPQQLGVGAELPGAPALFETSLAAPITATANSFTLTSNTVRGGGSLSGYNCFTIDEGSAQAEFVCGTASGTAVTNVTRGISPSDGVSEVNTLKFAHRRGASVKITDFPIIQILRNQNNGEATFENVLRYAGSVTPSGANDLADVGYVLSVVSGGTINFDALVVAGIAGETLATSTLVYFKSSDQRWWKVDTDDTATFQGVALGLTRGVGTSGVNVTNGGILLKGLQTGLTALTAGATYHASSSAGNFNTATSVLPIGVAKSITELYFDPVIIGVPRLGFNNTFTGSNMFTGTTTFSGPINGATNIQVFTSNATWTKPTNAKFVEVFTISGGGGGGGGAVDATADNVGAGGGGQGGGISYRSLNASALTDTVTVTVGASGTGGLGATSAGNGANGTAGGDSSFGTYIKSFGGAFGAGGTTLAGGNGGTSAGTGTLLTGSNGGNGGTNGNGTAGTAVTTLASTGGGGGASTNSGGTSVAGSAGGAQGTFFTLAGGMGGTGAGGNGSAGNTWGTGDVSGGTGGGGGGNGFSQNAGNGGNGGVYGSGGGGGGGVYNTAFDGGNGGNGGNGAVIVITY